MSRSNHKRLLAVLGEVVTTPRSAEPLDIEAVLVYLAAEEAGQDALRLYPQIAQALAASPAWQQEYAAIKAFLAWEAHRPMAQPPRPPRFDFSYLRAPAPVAAPTPTVLPDLSWYWAQLGYLVVELSDVVVRGLQPAQPQPAYSFARAAQGAANAYHFTLENQLADLNLRLTIEREQPASDECQVIVEAEIPSRGGWPNLADTIVNLKQADTVVKSRLTDAFGRAVFPAVAISHLPALQVEVIPGLPPADPDHRSG